ncbi:MAG: DUF2726 domain-containing protein [Agitococcus sp.]|nr:DUF2726 domain-containing protein [Agitococcus sp.]
MPSNAALLTFLVLVLVVIALRKIYVLYQRASQPRIFFPKPVLTPNEIQFFKTLQIALPQYIVLAQVAMGALLTARQPAKGENAFKYRGKFSQKIVDFVVLDTRCQVITLIELDDSTHDRKKDADRDAITAEAGYPTIRYQSKNKPSTAKILQDVLPFVKNKVP